MTIISHLLSTEMMQTVLENPFNAIVIVFGFVGAIVWQENIRSKLKIYESKNAVENERALSLVRIEEGIEERIVRSHGGIEERRRKRKSSFGCGIEERHRKRKSSFVCPHGEEIKEHCGGRTSHFARTYCALVHRHVGHCLLRFKWSK